MNANELMIGDLVCYDKANNYYTQIKEIKCTHDIPDDVVYYIKGMRDRRDRLWIEFEETFVIDILSPIPLSAEILEKNGFKKDAFTNLSPDYYFDNDEYSICVNLNSTCDKSKSIWIEKRSSRFTVSIEESRRSLDKKPLYVHQLQHALKLCGIQKEIVL